MAKSRGLQDLLDQAKEKEKTYDWVKAAEVYGQTLDLVAEEDFLRRGEIQEQIGYCLYRGAFQAETQEEFRNRIQEAGEAYEKAAEVYENVEHARSLHARAMALYAKSSILIGVSPKKGVLDDCAELLKEAMEAFEEAGEDLRWAKACNDLLFCLKDRGRLEWDWTEVNKYLEDGIQHGQKAISTLSRLGDEGELARAYYSMGSGSEYVGLGYLGEEKREEFIQKASRYSEKALELSKRTGDSSLIARSASLAASFQIGFASNLEVALGHAEEGLRHARKTKDNFLIGLALFRLEYTIFWMMTMEENPDKKREGLESAIRHAEAATRHLLSVCRSDYLADVFPWLINSYYMLVDEVETDPEERRNLLERAIEVGHKGLEYAKQSGTPGIGSVFHSLSKVQYSLSKLEAETTRKRQLLTEALEHREEAIRIFEQGEPPSFSWNHGVLQNYAALIKAEFAAIETNAEKKRVLLEEAVSHMERCIELCGKWTTISRQAKHFAVLGLFYDWFGDILNQLYSLTGEKEALEKAVEVYQRAAESYRKAKLLSRVAEANWHIARLYDQLGEHINAERGFQSAAENYRLAAERIPRLKEFYGDHARYMQAWSEIEQAKHHHAEKQYGQAKEHYEKAANLHKSTERWSYLAPNYLALALVGEAEDLSRKEQAEEAKALFEQAAKQFVEAKEAIQTRLETIEVSDETAMATQLAKASATRRDYCLGRSVLEEAKILDRQGNHDASSRSYGDAAEQFRKVTDAMERESDRRELRPLVGLCLAWQMMTRAEAETSPELYLEASQLFDEARKHSVGEKAKVLSLGHSSFCKALEAGARFEATSDTTMHSAAKRHMEAAEKYYLKAGFKTASGYAKATYMLFDAYMYMHKAETGTDPRERTQYYQMAEKLLQASAGSYAKAKHPEKSEEVGRLLEGVREKRQLAMSLAEVLHVPTITSSTTSFSTPTPTHEQAVGLERFEHADVQANLILRVKEVRVGEDMRLAIEVVNAGKAPALLIKVDEVIPEGFEIREVPEMYTFEDSYINMKGKRLNPLKTEDVKIVVKPRSKGTHVIKPRILYIDETGKYKSHEPEPVTIVVKELGIKDWIKGET